MENNDISKDNLKFFTINDQIFVLPTGTPAISACNCMRVLLQVIPPSTCSLFNAIPESFCIASKISRVWKHTASSAARAKWALVLACVKPQIVLQDIKKLEEIVDICVYLLDNIQNSSLFKYQAITDAQRQLST